MDRRLNQQYESDNTLARLWITVRRTYYAYRPMFDDTDDSQITECIKCSRGEIEARILDLEADIMDGRELPRQSFDLEVISLFRQAYIESVIACLIFPMQRHKTQALLLASDDLALGYYETRHQDRSVERSSDLQSCRYNCIRRLWNACRR